MVDELMIEQHPLKEYPYKEVYRDLIKHYKKIFCCYYNKGKAKGTLDYTKNDRT